MDKVQTQLEASAVFKEIVAYPRRYFDDLVLDQVRVLKHTENQVLTGLETQKKLKEMIQLKMPFGLMKQVDPIVAKPLQLTNIVSVQNLQADLDI